VKLLVLGPIEAVDETGTRVDLGGPTQRRLAAVLAVHAGHVVSAERLGDLLGVSPGGVRTAIRRLRQVLGNGAIVTAPPGYVLEPGCTDVAEFRALIEGATGSGPRESIALLDGALALWRGGALEEFGDEDWAQAVVAGLDEHRMAAHEERAEAQLRAGHFAEVAAEMAVLVQEHPYRDGPRGLLMRALAAQGRQTDALRAYQAYRSTLADEVGTEPSQQLRELERRIATGWTDTRPRRSLTNLPRDPSSFVGRHQQLAELRDALTHTPLVTIIGVGGIGKTRLALELGRTHDARDGTWLVELGLVATADQVDDAVAASLRIATVGRSAREATLAWAADREALLIVDNCEHVLEAVAELLDAITSTAANMSVLATSREPIGARGEHLLPLGALSLPGPDVEQAESVELFVDRAEAVHGSAPADMQAIEEICRRLDGIPLAIELAAARTRTMSAHDIADHLDERFRLLTGGRRRTVARHQTLRAAIDWSYRLLDLDEQVLLTDLSVLEGPFTLQDAVGIGPAGDDEVDVLNRLSSLVDRSLVVHSSAAVPYRLLETIRAYGRLHLDASGRLDATRARHAGHFRDKALALWPAAWTAEEPAARRVVVDQGADFTAAARWACEAGELELVALLVPAIYDLTNDIGGWPGATRLLHDLVTGPFPARTSWAGVYAAAAVDTIFMLGQLDRGEGLAKAAIDLDPQFGYAYTALGFARVLQGDVAGALEAAEHGRRLTSRHHLRWWGQATMSSCWYLDMLGRDAAACLAADELLACGTATGAVGPLLWGQLAHARIASAKDPVRALEWFERAEPLVEVFDGDGTSQQLRRDRASALLDIDPVAAAADLRWCLATATEEPFWSPGMVIAAFPHVVVALARLGDPENAALVAGSPYSLAGGAPFEQRRLDRVVGTLRTTLGDRFDELARHGAELTPLDLSTIAKASLDQRIEAAGGVRSARREVLGHPLDGDGDEVGPVDQLAPSVADDADAGAAGRQVVLQDQAEVVVTGVIDDPVGVVEAADGP
jgi:predicted ATPase/DNA-binding SARP family transcriptional activator